MQIVVKGKNVEVTEALRSYVEKKIGRLDRYLDHISECTVELTREMTKSAQARDVVQVTMLANGTILRAEERAGDMYAGIDTVFDTMHRQLVRFKERLHRARSRTSLRAMGTEPELTPEELARAEEEEGQPQIARVKRFAMKPMTAEEAAGQMELIGHDFFVFYNADRDTFNVLYRRQEGGYGLIEPVLA